MSGLPFSVYSSRFSFGFPSRASLLDGRPCSEAARYRFSYDATLTILGRHRLVADIAIAQTPLLRVVVDLSYNLLILL